MGTAGTLYLGVQPLEAGEEMSLLRHGVVGPGLGDDAAVQRAEHGQGHAHRDDDGPRVPQDFLCRGRPQVIVLGIEHGLDLGEGQDPVDRVVEEDVEDRDASDAEEKRPRQVLVGFPYLLGHKVADRKSVV